MFLVDQMPQRCGHLHGCDNPYSQREQMNALRHATTDKSALASGNHKAAGDDGDCTS